MPYFLAELNAHERDAIYQDDADDAVWHDLEGAHNLEPDFVDKIAALDLTIVENTGKGDCLLKAFHQHWHPQPTDVIIQDCRKKVNPSLGVRVQPLGLSRVFGFVEHLNEHL